MKGFFVASAVVLLGSMAVGQTANGTRTWGTPVGGFLLSLSSAKQSFAADGPIVVDLVVKNVSRVDRKIVTRHPLLTYQITVRDRNGQTLPTKATRKRLLDGLMTGYAGVPTLAPGEEDVAQLDLAEIYEFMPDQVYVVVAERFVWIDNELNKSSLVPSNSLEIRVKPQRKKRELLKSP